MGGRSFGGGFDDCIYNILEGSNSFEYLSSSCLFSGPCGWGISTLVPSPLLRQERSNDRHFVIMCTMPHFAVSAAIITLLEMDLVCSIPGFVMRVF